jgi:DNA-binding response OmpR family regulator
MDVVKAIRARAPESLVTIVTGYASLETAIEAIRLGAYDYITKPFSLDEIGVQVRNMIERVSLSKENARLSVRLQEVYQQIDHLQSERVEMLKFQEQILSSLREATGKLDQLLQDNGPSRKPQTPDQRQDKNAISGLFRKLEKLDRMKGSSTMSLLELEEKKRTLIDEFVSHS